MMSDDRDLGLDTLRAVKEKLKIDLSDKILADCFEIQKRNQFSIDDTLSTKAMERLIDDHVELASDKQRTNSE